MTYPAIPQVSAARDAYVFVFAVDGLVLSSLSIIFYGKMGFLDFSINFLLIHLHFSYPVHFPAPLEEAGSCGLQSSVRG